MPRKGATVRLIGRAPYKFISIKDFPCLTFSALRFFISSLLFFSPVFVRLPFLHKLIKKRFSLPSNTPLGNCFVIYIVDEDNSVAETNENNNTTILPITLAFTETVPLKTPLYPNPTSDLMTLEFDQLYVGLVIEVHNTLGQVVLATTPDNIGRTTLSLGEKACWSSCLWRC